MSDASPLINLARIGKLELLHELYGELIVPEAVWQEVVVEGARQAGADEAGRVPWIQSKAVSNRQLAQALRQDLNGGEAESIALALETEAELLLMDERLGRETARHLGLRYTGLIGVLTEAKRKGIVPAVKPYLDALREVARFHVRDELYLWVLRNEEET